MRFLKSSINDHQRNYDGIIASNLNPMGVFSIFLSNRNFYHTYTVTVLIHRPHNLIGTLPITELGQNRARFFKVIL